VEGEEEEVTNKTEATGRLSVPQERLLASQKKKPLSLLRLFHKSLFRLTSKARLATITDHRASGWRP